MTPSRYVHSYLLMKITAKQLSNLIREAALGQDDFTGVESVGEMLDGLSFIIDNIRGQSARIEWDPTLLEILERAVLAFNRATIDMQYAAR